MNNFGLMPVLCSTASTARSAMPARAKTAPRDTAPTVLLARIPAGEGVLRRAAPAIPLVFVIKASRIMWRPGTIRPPRCRPWTSTLSNLTAVPASSTQNAERALFHAAIKPSHRSAPNNGGSR